MSNIGQRIINEIIKAPLCHAECVKCDDDAIGICWSSGAAEQIEAVIAPILKENMRLIMALKFIEGCEDLKSARNAAQQAGICAGRYNL